MRKNLELALKYLEEGWNVIPIKPKTKIPIFDWLPYQKQKVTKEQLTAWLEECPDANIAVITGKISGLVIIDVDDPIEGEKSFRKLFGDIQTQKAKTPHGYHYYFNHPGDKEISNAVRIAPGLDVRADGGYVLVAPSVLDTPDEKYQWLKKVPRVTLPKVLLVDSTSSKPRLDLSKPKILVEGEGRDNDLTRIIGKLIGEGKSQEETFTWAFTYTTTFHKPPLTDKDINRIINSISKKEAVKQSQNPGNLLIIDFEKIQEEKIEWLWNGVIPKGKLTLLIGDPGHGKSLLSVYVAATLSAGAAFPDGSLNESCNVLMIFCEDGAGDTVKPRLRLANANLSKVKNLTMNGGFIKLDSDLIKIEEAIISTQAKLLIIDPISAYLGNVDSWKDDKVRALLARIGDMASRNGCAILCIMHLNKRVSSNAIDRGMGSVAFSAVAR